MWLTISSARTSSVTPRASLRRLGEEFSETLAVVRNGTLTRVGSVASVVATTSSIAIQGVVILDCTHSRQWVAKIFFHEVSGAMLRVRDIHHGPRPFQRPSTHRVRALRKNLVRRVSRSLRSQNFA